MAHHKKRRTHGRLVKKKRHRKSQRAKDTMKPSSSMTNTAMNPDTEIMKFRIAVIESLSEGEIHTGTKLYEGELKPLRLSDDSITTSLHIATNIAEFDKVIHEIINSLSGDELVTLHVEAHGAGERGILLSSGEILGWKDFMDLCRSLNEVLNGLLIVTMSMCYSLPILGSVDPTKRAPFKAILLTNKDVTVDEVERGFVIYFQNFKNILDVFRATGAIRGEVNKGDETSSPFHLMVADTIFDLLTDPDRDPEGFSHIVNDNFCRLKALNPEYTKERTETEIRAMLDDLAKTGKDYFTFRDVIRKDNKILSDRK